MVEKLTEFEEMVYKTRISLTESGISPSNKVLAKFLSTEELSISRNAVKKARSVIVHKMKLKSGW